MPLDSSGSSAAGITTIRRGILYDDSSRASAGAQRHVVDGLPVGRDDHRGDDLAALRVGQADHVGHAPPVSRAIAVVDLDR